MPTGALGGRSHTGSDQRHSCCHEITGEGAQVCALAVLADLFIKKEG